MTDVVTRFAPSPTGLMHLGNVRTALLNWLYAQKFGGKFLLRFEDTDRERSEAAFIEALKDDLQWLGLNWDDDVLFQSENSDQHQKALDALAKKDLAYRCFCTESQLNIDRKLATSRGLPPRYSQRCRKLSHEESTSRAEHEAHVWRLAIHQEKGDVHVHDSLRGDVHFACRDLDDPVVVRSDGTFTFLLPNAIDDALDGITHTLRGDDHLTNSAYQVWMLKNLGYTPPAYLHHGLLLGADGAKLSKRTGSHSVAELRDNGLLPHALVQAMGRLGHPNMPDDALTPKALAECLDADKISTSSVKWSDDDMWRWHTKMLHALTPEALAPLIQPYLPPTNADNLQAMAALLHGNLERAEDASSYHRLLDEKAGIEADAVLVMAEAGVDFYRSAIDVWSALDGADWRAWTQALKEATGKKGKGLFLPLRIALTGLKHGPEMSHVVEFLGVDGVRSRLEDAMTRIDG